MNPKLSFPYSQQLPALGYHVPNKFSFYFDILFFKVLLILSSQLLLDLPNFSSIQILKLMF
jgi:hypothetical protein